MKSGLIWLSALLVACVRAKAGDLHVHSIHDIVSMRFMSGKHTTWHAPDLAGGIEQLGAPMNGRHGRHAPREVTCRNIGRTLEGDVEWECTPDNAAALEQAGYRLVDSAVDCEYFPRDSDTYIVAGSCAFEYNLEPLRPDRSDTSNAILFGILFCLVVSLGAIWVVSLVAIWFVNICVSMCCWFWAHFFRGRYHHRSAPATPTPAGEHFENPIYRPPPSAAAGPREVHHHHTNNSSDALWWMASRVHGTPAACAPDAIPVARPINTGRVSSTSVRACTKRNRQAPAPTSAAGTHTVLKSQPSQLPPPYSPPSSRRSTPASSTATSSNDTKSDWRWPASSSSSGSTGSSRGSGFSSGSVEASTKRR